MAVEVHKNTMEYPGDDLAAHRQSVDVHAGHKGFGLREGDKLWFMSDYLPLVAERLEKHPVVFAYLFGSQATEEASRLSDIDIALYVDDSCSKSERFDLRLRMTSELSGVVERSVDVIIMNDAPLALRYEVIKHGKVILCKDRQKRIDDEVMILSRYLDRRYYDKRRARIILDQIEKKAPVR